MSDPNLFYNPFQPGYSEDPYPHLQELRENDPVHNNPLGIWIMFRYDDIVQMLRDRTLSVEDRNIVPNEQMLLLGDAFAQESDRGGNSMLGRDPPDHTRLRRLVSKAFTPRMIEQLRPRVEELVNSSLDAAGPEWDVIDGLAFPLPFAVISQMLGTPETDSVQLRQWSGMVVRSLEPVADPEVLKAIAAAAENLEGLVLEIIKWKRANPADDLLSGLIAAEEDGDKLSEEELADQVALLYIAGHETTVNLIGNGILGLLRHRHQFERLRQDPKLAAGSIDEFLRFDSPVQSTRRITLSPISVGDTQIDTGAFVVLSLASANRDPAKWGPDADQLDITRQNAADHVSFGGGNHHCLGAHLARLEGEVAISRLIQRFPNMDIAGDLVWNGRTNLRGLTHLPVTTS
ncbi:MAG TPA: cytochrome P450 [Acidimicrobiales bacterium]|jgi:cytochrome P450|nr:cytochrome P450 [Acidimicrobiales bacterium]